MDNQVKRLLRNHNHAVKKLKSLVKDHEKEGSVRVELLLPLISRLVELDIMKDPDINDIRAN